MGASHSNNKNKMESLNTTEKQMLAFVDFSLFFKGHLNAFSLQERFGTAPSEALKAFALYKGFAPENIIEDPENQRLFQATNFKPMFEYDVRKTLVKLSNQISDGYDAITNQPYPIQTPSLLNVPELLVVARLSQAIMNGNAVSIIYTSVSSGSAAREVVPHSIVDNGLRWHVRGYDRKSDSFRDFVLTRISKVTLLSNQIDKRESKHFDEQWNTPITLEIVPHPNNIKYSTAIEIDYGMTDGMLKIQTNAALVGYLLRRWNVDCSPDAKLNGGEYQLWLRNHLNIRDVQNSVIAPGIS